MSADLRRERLEELLVERALTGLSLADQAELARLTGELGADAAAAASLEIELAAAALDEALAPAGRPAALPEPLRVRLSASARAFAAGAGAPPAEPVLRPVARRHWALTGWLLAAAALVLAFLAWRERAPRVPAPAERRAELLARSDTLRRDWSATEQGTGASGDVAWSQALQQGVLRIQGLAANDPTREQYQLWIFDETQQHPIDGGVFDAADGEILIPIDAKLRVEKPTLFAVTREKPGGVVVSDQKRIVLVAQI